MGLSKESVGIHAVDMELTIRKRKDSDIIVALAGNPNVGKSTVFNAMTGLKQHTGNWPGKTIASAQGYCTYNNQGYVMVDVPGCYSLMPHSAEEEVARDFICSGEADVVVIVCDAVCLERNMNLVLQILNQTNHAVVCVNLMDEAARKHIKIDLKELEHRLGIPVVGTAARNNIGIESIYRVINKVHTKDEKYSEVPKPKHAKQDYSAEYFVNRAEEICEGVVVFENKEYAASDRKKDRIFTGRLTGFPIMLLLLMGIFWLTISGANYPSKLLHTGLFRVEEIIFEFFTWIGMPEMLKEMLVHGMYRVMAWVVSVMLPPMAIFFPLFTILEDSGYLPRVAFNLDKCFKKCNACGKQALTMCMGFGCNAAGVVGCRIIDSPRERLIAIITNNFVPCNGRFPTLIVIITMFFTGSALGAGGSLLSAAFLCAFIVLSVFVTFLVSRILSLTILKGVPSSFTLELPPYRRPQVGKVIIRSIFDRTMFVLGRAIVSAAPAGILIWLLANLKISDMTILSYMVEFLNPVARILGMDGVILLAFILGLPANEIVIPIMIMAYLAQGSLVDISDTHVLKKLLIDNGWTWITAVNVMLFSLMHWPCATTCLTIRKETGSIKWVLVSFIIPTLVGVTICFLFTTLTKLL